uniref:GATOR2 complex protein WDR24 n=1 Tax=Steinernema glaseri TaxID=37863 RepID=A0A1I7Z9N1_9BILA
MEPFDGLSVNGAGTRVVAAARSAIRLYSLGEGQLLFNKEHKYPRGKRHNFYSSGSVSWSPVCEERIASTSINGTVAIWNPEIGLQDRNYKQHSAAAIKVNFSTHDRNLLVSGGKDGSIACYDLRSKLPIGMFRTECEQPIRDIQFLVNQDIFITADDSGFVRYWDVRKPGEVVKEFSVHFGPVNSISVLSNNDIATGGQDKFLRVWHPTSDDSGLQLKYWMETMSSVSKVTWDPYNDFHLLSCSTINEGSVHIWDSRRAYLPYVSFDAHTETCTDVVWLHAENDAFVSCGRDGRIIYHRVRNGEIAARHVSMISLDTGPRGDILTAVKQHVQNSQARKVSENKKHPMGRVEPSILTISKPIAIAADMSQNAFIALAKEYRVEGDSFQETCTVNAAIAEKYGQHQTAYSWRVIATLFEPLFAEDEGTAELNELEKRRGSKSVHDVLPDQPEQNDSDGKNATTIETFFPNGIPDTLTAGTDMYFGPEELNMQGMSSEPFPSVHALFGNGRAEANIPEDFFEPRQELPQWSSSESDCEEEGFHINPPISEDSSDYDEASEFSGISDEDVLRIKTNTSHVFDPLPMVTAMMYDFSDEGDIQMCATICLAMGEKAVRVVKQRSHAIGWIREYIEMLERLELWNISSMIIKTCKFSEVSVLGNECRLARSAMKK